MRVSTFAQIGFGIEAVEFGRADQAVDRGGAFAAGIGAGEQVVLAAQCDRAQGAFGGVVVDFDAAVVAVAHERVPTRQRVADRHRRVRFAREFCQASLRSHWCSESSNGLARASRTCSSFVPAAWPRISSSIAYSAPMRSSASAATGER